MFRVVMFVNDAIEFVYEPHGMTEGEATHVAQALAEFSKRRVEIQFRHASEESEWREW